MWQGLKYLKFSKIEVHKITQKEIEKSFYQGRISKINGSDDLEKKNEKKFENLDCKLEIGIWTENENEKIEDENMKPKWTFLFLFIKNFQCKGKLFPPTLHLRFLPIFVIRQIFEGSQIVPGRPLNPVS